MKLVQKYRTQLSAIIIILVIIIVAVFFISSHQQTFSWTLAILTFVAIVLSVKMYTIATYFYKTIKQVEENNSKSAEDVTFNDIMNQTKSENEEKIQKNEDDLDKLVDKISKEKEPKALSSKLLSLLAEELDIVQGIVFKFDKNKERFLVQSTYAYYGEESPKDFEIGEGLSGQVARDKESMIIRDLPDGYTKVLSGLGSREPNFILISPLIHEGESVAIIELAFFENIPEQRIKNFENVLNKLAKFYA